MRIIDLIADLWWVSKKPLAVALVLVIGLLWVTWQSSTGEGACGCEHADHRETPTSTIERSGMLPAVRQIRASVNIGLAP